MSIDFTREFNIVYRQRLNEIRNIGRYFINFKLNVYVLIILDII